MMGTFATTYYSSVVFANDMKHIHTHAAGHRFDRIHKICNEYYEKSNNESDTLVELALEKNDATQNSTLAGSILKYTPQNAADYDYEDAMDAVNECMLKYIESLWKLRDYTEDSSVQSMLDDIIRYWEKERDYKMVRRLSD